MGPIFCLGQPKIVQCVSGFSFKNVNVKPQPFTQLKYSRPLYHVLNKAVIFIQIIFLYLWGLAQVEGLAFSIFGGQR